MERKILRLRRIFLGLLSVIFMFPICINAQNYTSPDTSKTDSSKSDTSGTKKDSLGYIYYNVQKNNIYASNENIINSLNLQDSSKIDTSKSDSTFNKTDTLGYNNIKSGNFIYASNSDAEGKYYFLDSSMTDTNKTDTTKTDTMSYNNNGSFYTSNNKNSSTGNNSISNPIKNTELIINPIKHLTQKLKLNIYLMDTQTPEVQRILREYETKTYQSNGDNDELNQAAVKALENITEILTARQKKEWENAKDEWWASVNKILNLSSISKNRNNLQ